MQGVTSDSVSHKFILSFNCCKINETKAYLPS